MKRMDTYITAAGWDGGLPTKWATPLMSSEALLTLKCIQEKSTKEGFPVDVAGHYLQLSGYVDLSGVDVTNTGRLRVRKHNHYHGLTTSARSLSSSLLLLAHIAVIDQSHLQIKKQKNTNLRNGPRPPIRLHHHS